jgi:membrane protein
MIAVVGIVLFGFSILSTLLSLIAARLNYFLPLSFDIFLADTATFLVMSSVLFAALYRYLPDVELKWKDIRFGALVTGILFTLGRIVIGFYLSHKGTISIYGGASALIVLLLWIYYSAQIFYIGAEFTYVWSTRKKIR